MRGTVLYRASSLENVFALFSYLSKECGLYKASDLLLGDHVCEKSDVVIFHDYNLFDYVMLMSSY